MILTGLTKNKNIGTSATINVKSIMSAEDSPLGVPTALVYIENGAHRIDIRRNTTKDDSYNEIAIVCDNLPLVQMRKSKFGTRENYIAPGFAIDALMPGFDQLENALNTGYTGIAHGVKSIAPLLSTLKTGIYLICDISYFPTDGGGNFFWNINNEMTKNQAISPLECIDGSIANNFPAYLYPCKESDTYDENIVNKYIDILSSQLPSEEPPRGIAYYLDGNMSLLLHGHHLSCAAVTEGAEVKCITIIPVENFTEQLTTNDKTLTTENVSSNKRISIDIFGQTLHDIEINIALFDNIKQTGFYGNLTTCMECELNTRKWPKDYIEISRKYPESNEWSTLLPTYIHYVTESDVMGWIESINATNIQQTKASLSYLSRNNIEISTRISLHVISLFPKYSTFAFDLEVLAFQILIKVPADHPLSQQICDSIIDFMLRHGASKRYKGSIIENMLGEYWKNLDVAKIYANNSKINNLEIIENMATPDKFLNIANKSNITSIKPDDQIQDIIQNILSSNYKISKITGNDISQGLPRIPIIDLTKASLMAKAISSFKPLANDFGDIDD